MHSRSHIKPLPLFLFLALVVGCGATVAQDVGDGLLRQSERDARSRRPPTAAPLENLHSEVAPSVVWIRTLYGWGSGFLLNDEGDVATNDHVVVGQGPIFLVSQGKQHVPAILKWRSAELDMAVIRMCGKLDVAEDDEDNDSGDARKGARAVKLAVSSPNFDDDVLAVGFPRDAYGKENLPTDWARDPIFEPGNVKRDLFQGTWDDKWDLLMIQHSAPVTKGNSGGPLFDSCGRVIGVNTQTVVYPLTSKLQDALSVDLGEREPMEIEMGVNNRASFAGELARQLDQQGITYQSTLAPCGASAASDTPREARLFTKTWPYHAEVRVSRRKDGKVVRNWEANQGLGVELPPGDYQVDVRANKFLQERPLFGEKSVLVSHDATTTTIHIALEWPPKPFTVQAKPAEADITVHNICPRYVPGMELPAGQYDVEASAEGYVTKREAIAHGSRETVHEMKLNGLAQPFTIEPIPAFAQVDLLEHGQLYQAGIELLPDEYRVEVSVGLRKWVDVVEHGGAPTERRVALRFFDCLDDHGYPPGDSCPEEKRKGPEMVVVPKGSFYMGSEDEKGRLGNEGPVRKVTFEEPFAVSVHEVTFAQWDACVADGACPDWDYRKGPHAEPRRPVTPVRWKEAQKYVDWLNEKTKLGYRLLTESEWEYVARAGTKTPFHTGNYLSPDHANYNSGHTVEVGSFGPNDWGLRDVHGNVWEWTQDCYVDNYDNAPSNGSARGGQDCERVVRGGSFQSRPWDGPPPGGLENYPSDLRSASRRGLVPDGPYLYLGSGFRVARDFGDVPVQ